MRHCPLPRLPQTKIRNEIGSALLTDEYQEARSKRKDVHSNVDSVDSKKKGKEFRVAAEGLKWGGWLSPRFHGCPISAPFLRSHSLPSNRFHAFRLLLSTLVAHLDAIDQSTVHKWAQLISVTSLKYCDGASEVLLTASYENSKKLHHSTVHYCVLLTVRELLNYY